MKKLSIQDEATDFLLYTAPSGGVKVEVVLSNETLWLTQQRMAELFGVQQPAITKHLKNIFDSGELEEKVVCSILEHTNPFPQTSPNSSNYWSASSRAANATGPSLRYPLSISHFQL